MNSIFMSITSKERLTSVFCGVDFHFTRVTFRLSMFFGDTDRCNVSLVTSTSYFEPLQVTCFIAAISALMRRARVVVFSASINCTGRSASIFNADVVFTRSRTCKTYCFVW